ncbi:NmrA/HSCARG family protein [Actinomadura luteofluorescens]|uniref:NmrA/HSCARG family protein n=1 Tax=Actinomadura luteofluorescens TaxID=46163 RepID=UPI00364516D7
MSSSDAVLVIGATGNQGGATARQLLARGRRVHALVRDPGSPAARGLRDGGAVLVQGDLDDAESLRKAMNGVRAVFSVQALAYEPRTLAAEVRQGKTVADIAKESGVAHLVYSSVGGAERDTGIDHFESKAEIERHILALGMPATILRPVFFMNNLLHYADARDERVLSLPVRPDKPMQFIAADDIGVFAADAFDDPERSIGRQIELAATSSPSPRSPGSTSASPAPRPGSSRSRSKSACSSGSPKPDTRPTSRPCAAAPRPADLRAVPHPATRLGPPLTTPEAASAPAG